MIREELVRKSPKNEKQYLEKNAIYIESRIQSSELKNHIFDSIYLFSDEGLMNSENEDRITALINIKKPFKKS